MKLKDLLKEIADIIADDPSTAEMEVEVEVDIDYPQGHKEDGGEDWIVSPNIKALCYHKGSEERKTRTYVYLEVVG